MKFVFVTWVGEDVKPMSKGKISTHKSTIEKAFHVSLLAKNVGIFSMPCYALWFMSLSVWCSSAEISLIFVITERRLRRGEGI